MFRAKTRDFSRNLFSTYIPKKKIRHLLFTAPAHRRLFQGQISTWQRVNRLCQMRDVHVSISEHHLFALPAAEFHQRNDIAVSGIVPRRSGVPAVVQKKSVMPARRHAPLKAVLIWPPAPSMRLYEKPSGRAKNLIEAVRQRRERGDCARVPRDTTRFAETIRARRGFKASVSCEQGRNKVPGYSPYSDVISRSVLPILAEQV